MTDLLTIRRGDTPLLVSIPHSGTELPAPLRPRLTEAALKLPDTDWHIARLYNFLDGLGATVIEANYSRYVVDLNRPPDGKPLYPGQRETEICPTTTFADEPLYRPGHEFQVSELDGRIERYWKPYHRKLTDELARLKDRFGYALLWDAHSIRSQVPRFFQGRLNDLNLGTADGAACDPALTEQIHAAAKSAEFTVALNGRFKGGFITRNYGNPAAGVNAVQMEIAQINYMSESTDYLFDESKASLLRAVLRKATQALLLAAKSGVLSDT